MRVTHQELTNLCAQHNIPAHTAARLWDGLKEQRKGQRFGLPHLCFIVGGIFVVTGMAVLFTMGLSLGATARFGLTLGYVVLLLLLGGTLWFRKHKRLGGVIVTAAVIMAPFMLIELAVIFRLMPSPGFDPQGTQAWRELTIPVFECGLLAAASIAFYFVRFPLLLIPLALSIWIGGLHMLEALVDLPKALALWWTFSLGTLSLILAAIVDRRTERDHALWLYFFGAALLFINLVLLREWQSIGNPLFYAGLAGLALLSLPFDRCVFIIFGCLGILVRASEQWNFWSIQPLELLSLIPLGIACILFGALHQRYRASIQETTLLLIPRRLRPFLPRNRPTTQLPA